MDKEDIKFFLDTNILIYAYSDTELEKKEKVLSILESEDISISTQVINEFIWVMNRKYNIDLSSLTLIVHSIFELYDVAIITKTNKSTVWKESCIGGAFWFVCNWKTEGCI